MFKQIINIVTQVQTNLTFLSIIHCKRKQKTHRRMINK